MHDANLEILNFQPAYEVAMFIGSSYQKNKFWRDQHMYYRLQESMMGSFYEKPLQC